MCYITVHIFVHIHIIHRLVTTPSLACSPGSQHMQCHCPRSTCRHTNPTQLRHQMASMGPSIFCDVCLFNFKNPCIGTTVGFWRMKLKEEVMENAGSLRNLSHNVELMLHVSIYLMYSPTPRPLPQAPSKELASSPVQNKALRHLVGLTGQVLPFHVSACSQGTYYLVELHLLPRSM